MTSFTAASSSPDYNVNVVMASDGFDPDVCCAAFHCAVSRKI